MRDTLKTQSKNSEIKKTLLTGSAALALLLATADAPAWADDSAKAPADGDMTMQYHHDAAENKDNDPLEDINRVTSGFNNLVRGLILNPLIEGYKAVTPDQIQDAVSNAAQNLSEPITAVSSLLQGDTENAGAATERFLVNSTLGVGGLADPATDMGIESRPEDLGQAFGKGGMEAGPHIVLPILGPSNLRDATGDILTSIANPLPLAGKAAQGTVTYSDNKDAIDAATANSVDRYATEKSLYEQRRAVAINDGKIPAYADGPRLDLDAETPDPALATTPAPGGN